MANWLGDASWTPLADFSGLAKIPQLYHQAADQARQRQRQDALDTELKTLAQMGKLDPTTIGMAALKSGNLNTAMAAAQMAQTQADRQAEQGFKERTTRVLERKAAPHIFQSKDAAGNDVTMMWDETQGRPVPVQGGASSQPNNPYAAAGKFTETEGKAAGFADRMFEAEGDLAKPQIAAQGASPIGRAFEAAPMGVGNYAQSPEYQSFAQARDNFINAQLRRESGAAISASEYKNADRQYFPVPGDEKNPEILKQKAQNRRTAIEAMAREGGRSYSPKFTFEGGKLTPRQQRAVSGGDTIGGVGAAGAPQISEGQTIVKRDANGKIIARQAWRGGKWVSVPVE